MLVLQEEYKNTSSGTSIGVALSGVGSSGASVDLSGVAIFIDYFPIQQMYFKETISAIYCLHFEENDHVTLYGTPR